MSLEQEHNASNEPFIPEGLEYREEYWYDALEKIEAHERFVRWKKFAWYAAAAMVVGLALGIGYTTLRHTAQNQMAQHTESNHVADPNAEGVDRHEQVTVPTDSSVASSANANEKNSTTSPTAPAKREIENTESTPVMPKSLIKKQVSTSSDGMAQNTNSEKSPSRIAKESVSQKQPTSLPSSQRTEANSSEMNGASENSASVAAGTGIVAEGSSSSNSQRSGVLAEGRGPVNASVLQNTEIASHATALTVGKMKALPAAFQQEEPILSLFSVRVPRAEAWPISDYNLQAAAGISVWRDFSTHAGDVATDPFIRLSAERNFNRRWSMESGVEWTSISGPTAKFEQVYTTYDFNYINNITSVATNKLHYLTVPLLAKWRLKERMQLQAGTGVSVLLAGTNTITERQETAVSAQVTRTYNDNGYIAGFRRMNAFAQVGMQYWIGKQTAIGVNFQYGLTDITNNTYFGKAYIDRNSRLTIELKRNIL